MAGKSRHFNLKAIFVRRLIEWWDKNKRDFPWRRTSEPYAVLIAEVLLRKTTAQQVKKVYSAFLSKYPDPKSLSKADENNLKSLLAPLGMEHRRANLLVRLGKVLVEKYNGAVPTEADDLLQLPGVGMYSANAVLCFAYGRDVPLVDTNVVRVFQRVFGFQSRKKRPREDRTLWNFVASMIPPGNARSFNLAVIDFASAVFVKKVLQVVIRWF